MIIVAPPDLNVCFSRSGSRLASTVSRTFSSNTGFPKRTAISSERMYVSSVSLITTSPRAFSISRTHLFACPCGSMNSGHRRPYCTIVPFSALNASLGKPWMFHSRMRTGSPSVFTSE